MDQKALDGRSWTEFLQAVRVCRACLIVALILQGIVEGAPRPAGTKFLPLPREQTKLNAGLFFGVNLFSETTNSLDYAVNDAVAQAYVFAIELQIIPCRNVSLLISGLPTGQNTERLSELRGLGAKVVTNATRTAFWRNLESTLRLSDTTNSMVVISLSSHGGEFLTGAAYSTPFVLPQDGDASSLESVIDLSQVEKRLEESLSRRKLLIIDACREVRKLGRATSSRTISERFREAFAESAGRVVFASCDAHQISLEDPASQQGVFVGALLDGLLGGASSIDSPFITLGQVITFASSMAYARAKEIADRDGRLLPQQVQRPWFKGIGQSLEIPLAASTEYERVRERSRHVKEALQIARLRNETILTKSNVESIENAIDLWPGKDREELLELCEALLQSGDGNSLRALLARWKELSGKATNPDLRTNSLSSTGGLPPRENSGTLGPPLNSAGADPIGKPVLLVGPIDGAVDRVAKGAQGQLSEIVERCEDLTVRRYRKPLDAKELANPSVAGRLFAETGAQALIYAELVDLKDERRRVQVAGLNDENQVVIADLEVTILVASKHSEPTVFSKRFRGQETFLQGYYTQEPAEAGLKAALEKLSTDYVFFGKAGIRMPVQGNKK